MWPTCELIQLHVAFPTFLGDRAQQCKLASSAALLEDPSFVLSGFQRGTHISDPRISSVASREQSCTDSRHDSCQEKPFHAETKHMFDTCFETRCNLDSAT